MENSPDEKHLRTNIVCRACHPRRDFATKNTRRKAMLLLLAVALLLLISGFTFLQSALKSTRASVAGHLLLDRLRLASLLPPCCLRSSICWCCDHKRGERSVSCAKKLEAARLRQSSGGASQER